jgi:hypothetical protein
VKVHLRQIDAQPKRHVYQKEICIEKIHDSLKPEKNFFCQRKHMPLGGKKLQAATPLLRVLRSSITLLMHLTSVLGLRCSYLIDCGILIVLILDDYIEPFF